MAFSTSGALMRAAATALFVLSVFRPGLAAGEDVPAGTGAASPPPAAGGGEAVTKAFTEGVRLFGLEEYSKVVDFMDRVLSEDPGRIEARLIRAVSFMKLGRIPEACRDFDAYGERVPANPAGYDLAGKLLFESGHYAEAEGYFLKVLDLDSSSGGGYNNLGSVYVKEGRLDKAREAFEKGLAVDPDLAELHTNLGIVFFLRNDFSAAERSFLEAVKIEKAEGRNDPVLLANLGDLYLEKRELKDAVSAYRLALVQDGTLSDVRSRLAMALQAMGETDRARMEYETAAAVGGELPEAHTGLARIFIAEGNVTAALREFEAAIRMTRGRDPEPLEKAGKILDLMECPERALDFYRRAYDAGCRSVAVLEGLSRLLELQGAPKESASFFHSLEGRGGFDPAVLLAVARRCIFSRIRAIRDPRRGLRILEALADGRAGSDGGGFLEAMAAAYADLGDFERAVRLQESAIALVGPDSPLLPGLEKRLGVFRNGEARRDGRGDPPLEGD